MRAPEREYPLIVLQQGTIHGKDRSIVASWAGEFEPLDFEAGRRAKAWLETNISSELVPLQTYLALSEDESKLYGFFALDEIEVEVAPHDMPVMEVRKAIDPDAPRQHATKLAWIARSRHSDPGFGAEMFEYALLVATEAGSCALMVDAYDEATAQMWMERYQLRKPRAGAADWTCLWHAVGTPPQDFN